jgi:hypothetical protein
MSRDWDGFNYPTVEQLKQTYSNENFTPDTRHYLFDNEQLVGFVSSALEDAEDGRASLQFPFLKDEYAKYETHLMEKAISTLKDKGATYINSNIPSTWIGAPEILTKYGFEEKQVVARQFRIDTSTYDYSEVDFPEDIVKVDPVEDKEELVRVFATEMTQTPEQIGQIIDGWKEAQNIILNVIVKNNGEILSHSMVVKNQNDPQRAFMTHVSIYNDNFTFYRPLVTKFILNKLQKMDYKTVNLFVLPENAKELYSDFNFPMIKTVQYRKDL